MKPSVRIVLFASSLSLLAHGCTTGDENDKTDAHVPDPSEMDGGETEDAGSDASRDAAGPEVDASESARLSTTGLYADMARGTLASGVQEFTPKAALWSDGADKKRWVYLPPNTQIDTSKMDAWQFPVGTKLWKQFSRADKRIETRLLEKTAAETWKMIAFLWEDDQSDAIAVPEGLSNAMGTTHDVPSEKDCKRCHEGVVDTAIGFTAILLDHTGAGATLASLGKDGWLSKPAAGPFAIPGKPEERDALLYLHANCGNCHNDRTFISNVTDVDYTLKSDALGALEQTNSYRTIMRDLRKAGTVEKSNVYKRMSFRGAQGQMPPVGSEVVDDQGLSAIKSFVTTLNNLRDAGDAGGEDGGVSDGGSADAAADARADGAP